jgi:hypothetical protein
LHKRFVNTVAPLLASPPIYPPILLGEDELPTPFPIGVWVFANQCVWQLDATIAVSQIPLLQAALFQVGPGDVTE